MKKRRMNNKRSKGNSKRKKLELKIQNKWQ